MRKPKDLIFYMPYAHDKVIKWDVLWEMIDGFSPQASIVMHQLYAADGTSKGRTLAEIGGKMGLSGTRITQIRHKVLGNLRHPSRVRKYLETERLQT
jgi:DNA-directed RNA polymerase sigma subunit (sigma70/sigma32)